MKLTAIGTVFRKEFVENLRDRRTVFAALLLGPIMGPLLLAALLQLVITRDDASQDKPLRVAVIAPERAPNLIAWLGERGVTLETVTLDERAARRAVTERRHNMVLEIPPSYAQRLRESRPAAVLLYADASDSASSSSVNRLRGLLEQYSQRLAQLRLIVRGVDPLSVAPVIVQSVDVSTARSRGALLLGMLSYLVIVAMFMGGLYLAIDATAGERERGSLEPLFTTPAPRAHLIYGKLLAVCVYMFFSLTLTLLACALVLPLIRIEDFGMTADLGAWSVVRLILVTLPLIPLGAALMALVASFTRSYREAQSYLGFVIVVPTLPLAFVGALSLQPSPALMAIPSLSQHFLMTTLLRGDALVPTQVLISAGTSLTLGFALAWFAGRLYKREAILG